MKLLITGGAGFIGSNYVHTHLEKSPQDELVVLDALTYSGHRENLAEAEKAGLRFVHGRIEDEGLVRRLFQEEGFDAVIHFAAETHVDRSIEDPQLFITTNVTGTRVLLDAARDHSIERFHLISTDEVYGDLGFGSTGKFFEDSPLLPSNPYSASKAASELLALSYLRTFGLPVSISRCSNNYGPYQSVANFIPLFIMNAQQNKPLPLYGTGENIRDWLYVRDHCEAIHLILKKGKAGDLYNIGADNEQRNIDVVKMILSLLGKSEDLIAFVEDRKGHDERYAMGYEKLKVELGWMPRTSFEEGMRQTIDWYTLNTHERSYSSWRNRVSTLSAHQSHQQAPATDLQ